MGLKPVFLIVFLLNFIYIYGQIQIQRVFSIACTYDNDCVENSYCKREEESGTCQCKEHFILQTNKTKMECLPHPNNIGDNCVKDVQCQVAFGTLSHCKDNTCQCNEDAHRENDGSCYKSGKIGSVCSIPQECYVENSPTYCERGICVCHWLAAPVDNGTRCVYKRRIGDECDSDEQCKIYRNNTRCHSVCRCAVNYVISKNNYTSKCIQAADKLEDPCEEDQQCTEFLNNTQCILNKCECKSGYHEYNGNCWRSIYKGAKCTHDNECKIIPKVTNTSFCTNEGVCCIDGRSQLDETSCLDDDNSSSNLTYSSLTTFLLLFSLFYIK